MARLRDQVAVITGAANGLSQVFAVRFAEVKSVSEIIDTFWPCLGSWRWAFTSRSAAEDQDPEIARLISWQSCAASGSHDKLIGPARKTRLNRG